MIALKPNPSSKKPPSLRWYPSADASRGLDVASDIPTAERANALARLNPTLPPAALEDAYRKLTRLEGADLIQRNRALHRLLVNGVTVEYRTRDGEVRTLAGLRNTLLPKLTSGELRVGVAQLEKQNSLKTAFSHP